VLQYSVVIN